MGTVPHSRRGIVCRIHSCTSLEPGKPAPSFPLVYGISSAKMTYFPGISLSPASGKRAHPPPTCQPILRTNVVEPGTDMPSDWSTNNSECLGNFSTSAIKGMTLPLLLPHRCHLSDVTPHIAAYVGGAHCRSRFLRTFPRQCSPGI